MCSYLSLKFECQWSMSNSWILPSLTAREHFGEPHLHSAKLGNFSQEENVGTCRRSGVEMVFGAPADRLNSGSIQKSKNTVRGQFSPPTCNFYSLRCYQKKKEKLSPTFPFLPLFTKEERSNPPAPLRKDIIFK